MKSEHLKRYSEIAGLFWKYGRTDLARLPGLEEGLPTGEPVEAPKAEELAADLEKMGPTFIKLGQLLSTRADLLPPAYLEALSRLQDNVEPFPFEDVERIVTEELAVRISKAFAEFDHEPMASASLAQVHRALLRDGRQVAVKVQRPDIREQVMQDLDIFAEVAELADKHTDIGRRYQLPEIVDQFRRSLLRELDYQREAGHLHACGGTSPSSTVSSCRCRSTTTAPAACSPWSSCTGPRSTSCRAGRAHRPRRRRRSPSS